MVPRFPRFLLLPILAAPLFSSHAAASGADILRAFAPHLCKKENPGKLDFASTAPGAKVITNEPIVFRGQTIGWRAVLRFEDKSEIEATRIAPGGQLRRFMVEYSSPAAKPDLPALPALLAIVGPDCQIAHGRSLKRNKTGTPLSVSLLDNDLKPVGRTEPLDAPVPAGKDPGGVLVALVDSGVNYRLPQIAARLARGANGNILGYDYWDGDPRPFDADTSRSPFMPFRHGTRVASVVVREAPGARIVPYRYPRHDMRKYTDLVEAADKAGVRIVAMALGGRNRDHFAAFEEAARARPHMLFIVSAGNNGADIDTRPIYPAALDLANILTVTSSTADGTLGRGSNFGVEAVDIMVPAERVPVLRFDGTEAYAGGTSFAVPRVAALAARLLAQNPEWKAPDLKAAILARAEPSPKQSKPVTRHGWIATPSTD